MRSCLEIVVYYNGIISNVIAQGYPTNTLIFTNITALVKIFLELGNNISFIKEGRRLGLH